MEGVCRMGGPARVRLARDRLRFAAVTLVGAVLASTAILGLDSVRSQATDPRDPPTTNVVDHSITWARYPERTARTTAVDLALVEQCRASNFVVVTFSGTGMTGSQYQANMIQSLVEGLGGCVMFHWYGHTYDAAASARSVADGIARVTPPGRRKPVVFLGPSFGGIAAEDIAAEPAVAGSPVIELRRIIMIATPVSVDDLLTDVFGVPVPWVKDVPLGIPPFGSLVVLANTVNGQRQRGQLMNPAEWRETFVNAAKTRPVLMRSELERIRQGMWKVRADVPVDYLGSPDSDLTVDTDAAYARIENLITAQTRYFTIEQAGHDEGWLLSMADRYNAKLAPILAEMFGQPA